MMGQQDRSESLFYSFGIRAPTRAAASLRLWWHALAMQFGGTLQVQSKELEPE
jgi:hypothetical protein